MHPDLLIRFALAVARAFPENAERDRFGRYVGQRDTDYLRALAVELARDYPDIIPNGGQDTADQAGMVARAVLARVQGELSHAEA